MQRTNSPAFLSLEVLYVVLAIMPSIAIQCTALDYKDGSAKEKTALDDLRCGGPLLWRAIFGYGGPSLWRAIPMDALS